MIGQTIAHYRVTAKIGAGGMGEVYRATDSKLGRDVALKVLPAAFAQDAQRMARFQREAQLLASLNHPNIATIHGLEESGATRALVMELVEGPTLTERITQGALPVEEALPIAKQIAEALEYAHERGIIHRDLKPANIKLTPDGQVKVLDFGLAKALADDVSQVDVASSPTLSLAATKAGVILGTAAYMSPEQAKGKPADRRADIWAFGVVLYEMLTGRQLYMGETASEVMAHVITKDPDFTTVSATAPRRLIHLLRRCLAKDPGVRLRDIGEARIAIAEILAHPDADRETEVAAPVGGGKRRSWLLAAGVTLGLVAGGAVTWVALSGLRLGFQTEPRTASRFSIALSAEAPIHNEAYPSVCVAISRDGTRVVYSASGKVRQLYLRRLDELEVRPIPGTEGGTNPFFSPDGEWVGFFTFDGALKKVSLAGGNPVTLARGMPYSFFVIGSWSDDGRIVFDTWTAGLRVISDNGGEIKTLTAPPDEWHQNPQVLPGSQSILYLALRADSQRVEALSLNGGTPKLVLENASHARYLASGHLLFMRDRGLMVAPFDAQRLEVTGPATPLSLNVMLDDHRVFAPAPQLAVSLSGALVYVPGGSGGQQSDFVWVDRNGRVEEFTTLPLTHPLFQLSPEGGRLALVSRVGPAARIQTLDLSSKSLTRIADEPNDNPATPLWSPNGRRLFFTRYGTHQGTVLVKDLDGNLPPERLLEVRGSYLACYSISRDGRFLFYTFFRNAEDGNDIWVLNLTAPAAAKEAARPFLATSANEDSPVPSPDGRWVAYMSDESGAAELYIRRFPGGESKQRVSIGGGRGPQWSPDGRELFFQTSQGSRIMVASVRSEPDLRVEKPRLLIEGSFDNSSDSGSAYAVSRDARRFLMVRQSENPSRASELVVVQNWFAELKGKQKQ